MISPSILTDECHNDALPELSPVLHVVLDGGEGGGSSESEENGSEPEGEGRDGRVAKLHKWVFFLREGRINDVRGGQDICGVTI